MRNKRKVQKNRCPYCGKFFKPDNRVKDWQISCNSKKCRMEKKKEVQKTWLENNSGYFTGRYAYIKEWRKMHPDYQSKWRLKRRVKQKAKSSITSIKLVVPDKFFKGEIQDEIRLVKQCGCGFFIAG